MTALFDVAPSTREPGFGALLDILDAVGEHIPQGFRAEVIKGGVVVSPWSKGSYLAVMRDIIAQVTPHVPEGHVADAAPCLFVFPEAQRAFGPDLHVADAAAVDVDSNRLPGEALSLAAELTSASTRDTDWTDKLDTYGRVGVPVYLLLDMRECTASVFWDPSAEGYRARATVPFGTDVRLPEPFGCVLDTGRWKR